MWWLYLYVGLATAGILVLGVLGIRVYAEVLGLARQVGRSSADLTRAAEELQRAADPLAREAGEFSRP
ncbi:hypothetical protein ACFWVC_08395 [Streptomyces sp. NPDC058691]|uniref:hypothetical protein n=1 Tax=Streptomyces sp. NPDC058691 TaxID=3346601 RepID=UPI0036669E65